MSGPMGRVGPALREPPVLGVLLLLTGGYLSWFAIHYWRTDTKWPTDPIKAVLQGKPIPVPARTTSDVVAAYQLGTGAGAGGGTITTGGGGGGGGGGGTGKLSGPNPRVAADALRYLGAGYQFGGRADRVGNWDCSSFLSYVLGHDLGLALPGGGHYGDRAYPPHQHGPVAASYKLYGQQINRGQLGAGDIVAWNTHCGIAVDGSRIVSARTPAEGVGISTIDGTSGSIGETPVFRRIGAVAGGVPGGPIGAPVVTV